MMKRAIYTLCLLAALAAALATALTIPASAEKRNVAVRMTDGTVQYFVVDAPAGATLQDIRTLVPGEPIGFADIPPGSSHPPTTPTTPAPTPPESDFGELQDDNNPAKPDEKPDPKKPGAKPKPKPQVETQPDQILKAPVKPEGEPKRKKRTRRRGATVRPETRGSDGAPLPGNPGFVDALPGPSTAQGVPNFVIRKFRVPVFLLPIYQAAGIQYGVRWEVLAAINEIETDYGRNLNVSSAGALGWMQFMPATWRQYGTDANKDGKKDPYNPVDAIFAAARYLKAAGYEDDVRRSIFAYNHADWYVDSVMLRARLIAGVPADLVGSLTGLTEGRFPVAARARYADDLKEQKVKKAKAGENAANVVESRDDRRSVEIYAKEGAPVVSTNDGQVKKIGRSRKLGRYVIVQDVYGNRYTYAGLGSVAKTYAAPRSDVAERGVSAKALKANRDPKDPSPRLAASAGRQPNKPQKSRRPARRERQSAARRPEAAVKERLFAHPSMPGGTRQRRLGPAAGDAEQGRQHLRRLRPPGQARLQALQAAPPQGRRPGHGRRPAGHGRPPG